MNNKNVQIRASVPKTVQSAWNIGLISLLIVKIFEKIVEAFFFRDQTSYLVSLCIFAFLFAVSTAGILQRQRWGIGFAVVISILDILVASYTGGALAATSVVLGIGVLIGSYFVYKYSFDR